MTKEQIKLELQYIRENLLIAIQSKDVLLGEMEVNRLDSLIYKLHIETQKNN